MSLPMVCETHELSFMPTRTHQFFPLMYLCLLPASTLVLSLVQAYFFFVVVLCCCCYLLPFRGGTSARTMGNIVVGYVQAKSHFTQTPNVYAVHARQARRALPLLGPDAHSHPTTRSASRKDGQPPHTASRHGESHELSSPPPPLIMASLSTSTEPAPSQEDVFAPDGLDDTTAGATDEAYACCVFGHSVAGRAGWADASRGIWHAPPHTQSGDAGVRESSTGWPSRWKGGALPCWSLSEPKTVSTNVSAVPPVMAGDVDGMSSSAGLKPCCRATTNTTTTSVSSTSQKNSMEPIPVAAEQDDENEIATLLGTMDCADAHAYFFPPTHVYEALDSAVYRHPDTLFLAEKATFATAYTHGDGKYATPTAPLPSHESSSAPAHAPPPFISVAETLRRRAEAQPDVPALSWRHVERVERQPGAATGSTYYMSVPQSISFAALSTHIQAFRLGLRSLGLCTGDGLGLVERSCWEWLVTCYAAWSLGLVVTTFHEDPRCVQQVICEASDDLKCIVCSPRALPLLHKALHERELLASENDAERADESTHQSDPVMAESHTAKTGRSTRRRGHPQRPRPLLVVTNGAEDDTSSRTRGMQDGVAAPTATTSPSSSWPVCSDEEEALWWQDVMEAGRAVLYNVATRLAHSRRLRGLPYSRRLTYSRCTRVRPTDLALIVYTEGDAKGVLLTHGAVRAAVTGHAEYLEEVGMFTKTPQAAASARREDDAKAGGGGGERDIEASADDAEKRNVEEAVLQRLGEYKLDLQAANSEQQQDQPALSSPLTAQPTPRYDALRESGAALTRMVLAAVSGDVRSSTSEALSGFQIWWQQQQAVVRSQLSQHLGSGDGTRERSTYVICEPLHRVRELILVTTLLVRGAFTVCFGQPETLLSDSHRVHPCSDVQLYKPVLLSLSPHTLGALVRTVQTAVDHHGYSAVLFAASVQARRRAVQRGLDTPYLDTAVFAQTRQLLGGRCRLVVSHGAPLPPRVQEYLQVVCGAAIVQWLTLTEACGCGLAQLPWDGALSSVGGPMGPVEMKLRDAPRRGYLWPCYLHNMGGGQGDEEPLAWSVAYAGKDTRANLLTVGRANQEGGSTLKQGGGGGGVLANRYMSPSHTRRGRQETAWWLHDDGIPAGELLLRGPTLFCGYHAQPEHTVAALDRDGWLHTADVLQRHYNSNLGSFRVVDRLNQRAKTASARVVALEWVERVYGEHPLCDKDSVCVLVHPYRDTVSALLVTNQHRAKAFYQTPECQQALRHVNEAAAAAAAATDKGRPRDKHAHTQNNKHASEGEAPPTAYVWPSMLGDARFNAATAHVLSDWGARHNLPPHACVRRVRLVHEDWTQFRTATKKLRREAICRYYVSLIEEMFHEAA